MSLKWKTLSNCYAGLQENRSKNSTESCGRLQHVLSLAGGVLLGAMNNNWKLMEIFQAHRVEDFFQKISRSSNLVSVNTTHFMYSPTTHSLLSRHICELLAVTNEQSQQREQKLKSDHIASRCARLSLRLTNELRAHQCHINLWVSQLVIEIYRWIFLWDEETPTPPRGGSFQLR